MSGPAASGKATTPEKMERELLARLGLDSSATPEDVNAAHEAVSTYLAAAPRDLRSWARAQASGADEAYALLTDPAALARAVALVGAGARSAVLPGGPATPPVHRDSPSPTAAAVPPTAAAAPASAVRYDENGRRILSDDEIDALLAEADPNANREVVGTPAQRAAALTTVQPMSAPGGGLSGLFASKAFRNLALVGATVAAIGIVAVFGFNAGGNGAQAISANPDASAAPAASAAVLDQAKVGDLMGKIQANPKDADSLMALGDEYYRIGDYKTAGDWFTKVTLLEPTNVRSFLALGATAFNGSNLDAAEVAWRKALDIDPKSVEANYDLGFLYFNRQPPDMAKVQEHWKRVIELDPNGEIAKTVSAHLDAIASMVPASPAPGASAAPAGSTAPSAAPAASPAATPAASPAPSAAPSGTPQP